MIDRQVEAVNEQGRFASYPLFAVGRIRFTPVRPGGRGDRGGFHGSRFRYPLFAAVATRPLADRFLV